MAKTNFEHLKDICVGNDEALEFIEAAENDFDEMKSDLKKQLYDAQDEVDELPKKFDEKEADYDNTINAGIGEINWQSDNLQLQLVMEALAEKIQSVGPLKVLRLLEVRKPVPNR
jgi:hypothetical protein